MAVWGRYPVTGFRQREMMVKGDCAATRADAPIIVVWVRQGLKRPHRFAYAVHAILGRCVMGMERVFASLLV